MKKIIPLLLITLLFSMCNSNQQSQNEEKNELSGDVIIFHAGSLSVPLKTCY
jgi:ABC-type molybdate transport system substrate-binding protein